MIELIKSVTQLLRLVIPNAFYEWNTSERVTYPYLTFDLNGEYADEKRDSYTIDVDIFDNQQDYTQIFQLEKQLKQKFRKMHTLTDDFLLRFDYVRSNTVPTGDETIIRRTIELHLYVDWRK